VNFLGEEKPDLLHEEFSVAVLMLRYMSIVYTKKDTVYLKKHDLFIDKIVKIINKDLDVISELVIFIAKQ